MSRFVREAGRPGLPVNVARVVSAQLVFLALFGPLGGTAAAQGFGPGLYLPARPLPLQTSFAAEPVAGDADGDGNLDLVTPDAADAGLLVAAGDGTGALSGLQDWAMPPLEPLALLQPALADLDGDGRLELVAVPRASNSPVRVRLREAGGVAGAGRGAGWGEVLASATGFGPVTRAALGDLDGDGALDLVVAQGAPLLHDGAIAWARGRGDGRFDPGAEFAPARFPVDVALADADGDGWLDVVCVEGGLPGPGGHALEVWRHVDGASVLPGAGISLPGVARVDVTDLDGDAWPDLLIAVSQTGWAPGALVVAHGLGGATFLPTAAVTGLGRDPVAVTGADLDGDGWRDALLLDGRERAVFAQRLRRGRPEGDPQSWEVLPPVDSPGTGAQGVGLLAAPWSGAVRPDVLVTDTHGRVGRLQPGLGPPTE